MADKPAEDAGEQKSTHKRTTSVFEDGSDASDEDTKAVEVCIF